MEKVFKPEIHEDKIYELWEKSGAFKVEIKENKKPFCIIMPPPNANAPLHIGHVMFLTIEDILTRWRRMQGDEALWLPGADHAGILTQVVFERVLEKQGKTRYDLGRERFFAECYDFSQKNKEKMYQQMRKAGASCDWSRERFTLDPEISRVVLGTFVKLYDDGLAYRGERMVNWCPRCETALSDLEVEYEEKQGRLWWIKYPIKGEKGKEMIVATTRPETMLGDTAVAVHPEDKRYKKLVGKKVVLPLVGREIPIIADEAVDKQFGSGAVKVTPGHDPIDWEIGQRHRLETITVIGFDNKMTEAAGKEYRGLSPTLAREKVVQSLRQKSLLVKEESYYHRVGHCERCKTEIQPQVSKQWFVATTKTSKSGISLRDEAVAAVENGAIKIIPKRFEKIYFQWMKTMRDWCVSRQLWWGQRMPVWYCGLKGLSDLQKRMNPDLVKENGGNTGCGEVIVAVDKPEKCQKCGNRKLIQEPDIFDAWFSSGQWPYTTLGYGQKGEWTKDYSYFYPTTVMETGYEILFFWVARMIMLGLYSTKTIPFKTVYLHGLVRDALGEKMSKSKGNVVDPLTVIEKYGADALRMALVTGVTPGKDVHIGEEKIRGYRNFANKIWNIGRFVYLQILDCIELKIEPRCKILPLRDFKDELESEDWEIVKETKLLIEKVTRALDQFRFSEAAEMIYQFLWHRLADEYIEYAKVKIREEKEKGRSWEVAKLASVMSYVYTTGLKLLHPIVPFVTEAVWQNLRELIKQSKLLTTKEKELFEPELLIKAGWPES